VQSSGKELHFLMNLTVKCMLINLGTLEVLVSQSEKHIFNKLQSIFPRWYSGDFFLQDLEDSCPSKAWWIQIRTF